MGDDSKLVRVPRAWVFLVMGAAILGAGMAAVAMVSWIVPRLAKNEAARVNAPVNPPANEPAANRAAPPANVPSQPPPVKPPVVPPDNTSTPPKEEPPPPPPPPEDPPKFRADCVWDLPVGAAFKYKAAGGAWLDGTDQTELSAGMRVKVTSGRVEFDLGQCRMLAPAGCDMTVASPGRDPRLALNEGNLILQVAHGLFTLVLPQQEVALRGATLVALASPAFSEIELTCGKAMYGEKTANADETPSAVRFGAGVETRALDLKRVAEIENALRAAREVLLAWDFESTQLPCSLGKRLVRGFRNSAGALGTAPEFAAIGDEGEARFTPTNKTRIRLRLKTNARYVRVNFTAGTGRLAEIWSCVLLEHERDHWALYEISLADFSAPFKEARPWAGQSCHSLQFRMRFDDTDPTLPSERYLVIDDVEIFTPK